MIHTSQYHAPFLHDLYSIGCGREHCLVTPLLLPHGCAVSCPVRRLMCENGTHMLQKWFTELEIIGREIVVL